MSDKAERLVNLVVALDASPRPLTFAELRERMGEWVDGDAASMRRKFERDKDELRRLGVPIETVTTDAIGGEAAYAIERRGRPSALTAEQATAVAVALRLVEDGPDPLSVARLTASSPTPARAPLPQGVRVRLDAVDPVLPIADAVARRRVVRFRYRGRDGAEGEREVAPHAVVQRAGAWYVAGYDRAREATRSFRLDRVVGEVHVTDEDAGSVPEGLDPAELVAVPPTTDLTVLVQRRDGSRVERHQPAHLAVGDVLRAAPAEAVVAPPEVAAAVEDALRSVLRAHGETVATGGAS